MTKSILTIHGQDKENLVTSTHDKEHFYNLCDWQRQPCNFHPWQRAFLQYLGLTRTRTRTLHPSLMKNSILKTSCRDKDKLATSILWDWQIQFCNLQSWKRAFWQPLVRSMITLHPPPMTKSILSTSGIDKDNFATLMKREYSYNLCENWCPFGPPNYKTNSEKTSSIGHPVQFQRMIFLIFWRFLKNGQKMRKIIHKNWIGCPIELIFSPLVL